GVGAISLIIVAVILFALAWVWQVKVVNTGWLPAVKHAEFIEEIKKQERAAKKAAMAAKAAETHEEAVTK
ncbi:hypothetical protein CG399_09060, partial [Bifidobacteriaceae bacterium NR015]